LLEAYTSVLEKDKAYFIYEYLQFFMMNKNNGYNLFSIFKDIFSCNLNEINEVRTLLKYYKMVIRTNKSSSLKQYETNLYKIQNDLERRIAFTRARRGAEADPGLAAERAQATRHHQEVPQDERVPAVRAQAETQRGGLAHCHVEGRQHRQGHEERSVEPDRWGAVGFVEGETK
jgi:hypothetical protein